MMNVFKFEMKRLFKPMIIWSMICILCIILFMSFYPSMSNMDMQDLLTKELDSLPETMKKAFNLSGALDFSKLSDYTVYVIQYIAMAAGIYGAILGVSSLVKEESDGTIAFLYSKPISRSQIVTAKLLSSLVIFTIFILLLFLGNLITSSIIKPKSTSEFTVIKDLLTIYMGMFLLGIIFMSLGFLISSLIKSARQSIPIALVIFFATYILGIAGNLKESLSFLLYLSPSQFTLPNNIIKNGFQIKYVAVGFIIIIVSLIGTYYRYNRKDFA